MNNSTSGNASINTISKNLEKQHVEIKIGFGTKALSCVSTENTYSLLYWVMTISLVLCSLGGVIFGICNWISISSNFDESKATKLSPDFDQEDQKNMNVENLPESYEEEFIKKYPEEEIGPSIELFSDETKKITNSSPKLTISTDLTTDTNLDQGDQQSERTKMDFTTTDIDRDGICEEFEFSTKDKISESSPSLTSVMGIYTLEKYYSYNGKVVYYNRRRDVFLYYHDFKNIKPILDSTSITTFPVPSGLWRIGHYPDTGFVFVENPFCVNVEYPGNGKCEFGWHHLTESWAQLDHNAYVMCRKPKPISNNVPTNSICTKFELSSGREFQENGMEYRLNEYEDGEYQLMNISYNNKVVYQKLDPINNHSTYMYYDITADFKGWVIGFEIGFGIGYAGNSYCSEKCSLGSK